MGWTCSSYDRVCRSLFTVFVGRYSVKAINKREDNIRVGCRVSGSVIVLWTRC
jgi:hypothetical protein